MQSRHLFPPEWAPRRRSRLHHDFGDGCICQYSSSVSLWTSGLNQRDVRVVGLSGDSLGRGSIVWVVDSGLVWLARCVFSSLVGGICMGSSVIRLLDGWCWVGNGSVCSGGRRSVRMSVSVKYDWGRKNGEVMGSITGLSFILFGAFHSCTMDCFLLGLVWVLAGSQFLKMKTFGFGLFCSRLVARIMLLAVHLSVVDRLDVRLQVADCQPLLRNHVDGCRYIILDT